MRYTEEERHFHTFNLFAMSAPFTVWPAGGLLAVCVESSIGLSQFGMRRYAASISSAQMWQRWENVNLVEPQKHENKRKVSY
ncbi:hypothetical protein BaRGS_00007877 [Batillaria attramentaria]|uniref:Uncharacterized protein n=1 Tax=Batillaria attramentaria TaxID=370345 RepID=A0ABD0LPK1_9CAEN